MLKSRVKSYIELMFIPAYCSHFNANRYWTESLDPNRAHFYPAYKCSNWSDYKNGHCSKNQMNYMGLNASANTPGVFYLELKTKTIFNHDEQYIKVIRAISKGLIEKYLLH